MKWNFKPELVCLFGQPVAENPTQHMIEAAFRHHGLDWRYVTMEVAPEQLEAAVAGMRAMGFRGGNCTIPHKVAVQKYLDRIGESASLIGAVNCIVRQDDLLVGENTDGKGFLQSLRDLQEPRGRRVMMFGAGGAARAIAVELALAGVEHIQIWNRSEARGRELVDLLHQRTDVAADFHSWQQDAPIDASVDVLVNATSIGLFPQVDERIPLIEKDLRENLIVADVIPNPPQTRLIREARSRGCQVLDGLGMLVNQGVLGFRYWTGVDPDPAIMRAALEEVFGT
ncbi:MAG: shikimate dehydrogenase [Planctomycetota bacterium]|nr:MAG: shikimate dehydrogenase [Planctomycetota bacterium]